MSRNGPVSDRGSEANGPGAVWYETAVTGAGAVATFLAISPLLRAYQIAGEILLFALACVLSTVVAAVTARLWRRSPTVSYPLSASLLVLLLLFGAGPHPVDIWTAMLQGPNRIVTETLPLTGPRANLAAPIVLTWLCGAATTELLMRGRSRWSGLAALGLTVPLGVYALAYAVAAAAPHRDWASGPLLLIVLAAVALARQELTSTATQTVAGPVTGEEDSRPSGRRGVALGAAMVVALTAVLAAMVPSLPTMSDRAVSLNRAAPTVRAVVVDPVNAMEALRESQPRQAARTVLQVITDRRSTGYLGMAILDDYDGAVWSFDAAFRPTGLRVPTAVSRSSTLANSTVSQRVTIFGALPVPLLVALDRPLAVKGLAVTADAATGMLLPAGSASGNLAYTAISGAPDLTLASVPAADGLGQASGDLTLPPDSTNAMGTAIRVLAGLTGQRPGPNLAFLQALANALHGREKRVDPTLAQPTPSTPPVPVKQRAGRHTPPTTATQAVAASPGGTSLSEAINAVTITRAATPEQFATLFAMVARYLGAPARVVTGFRVGASSSGGALPPGSYQVTNRQAWTWVEIPVAGLGWVVADPTPDAGTAVVPPRPLQVQAPATTLPPRQANAVPRNETVGGHALAKPTTVRVPTAFDIAIWALLLIALGAASLVLIVVGPAQAASRRWLRRRSRHGPDPGEMAVGAWLELLDTLSQAGMETAPGSTSSEVAAAAGDHFGYDLVVRVAQVGALSDQAVCSTSVDLDRSVAQVAWDTQRSVRRSVLIGLDRRQRARALMIVGHSPRRPVGASASVTDRRGS